MISSKSFWWKCWRNVEKMGNGIFSTYT